MSDMFDNDPAAHLRILADIGLGKSRPDDRRRSLDIPPMRVDPKDYVSALATRGLEHSLETAPDSPTDPAAHLQSLASRAFIHEADRRRAEEQASILMERARQAALAERPRVEVDRALALKRAESRRVQRDRLVAEVDHVLRTVNAALSRRIGVVERAATLADVNPSQRIISILAVPYEDPTPVLYDGERWTEVVSRSAFNGFNPSAPKARSVPVSAVLKAPAYSHEDAHLVGRVISADTNHPDGLLLDTKISKTPVGDEVLTLANDGALHPSIGFVSQVGSDTEADRSTMTRRVNRAFLDHLTYVPTPAYDGARVLGLR